MSQIRPAFVATGVKPDIKGLFSSVTKSGEVRINVQLLANGQVGDIVVFSDLEKPVLRAFANAAEKMRFVPADKNGTAVD